LIILIIRPKILDNLNIIVNTVRYYFLNMTYRSKTDIIAVILKTASINGGAVKSKIMYEGFLAWAQVQEYLSLLLKNDLIKYQERGRTFIITEKGIRFLNVHNDLNKLMTAKQIENNKTAQTSSAQTAPEQ